MKLIIGLGNPGRQYSKTRHNAGFRSVDALVPENDWKLSKKFQALLAEKVIGNEKVLLVKPQTFMNKSGEAVRRLVKFYKIKIKDVLIIYDDIDLFLGQARLRLSGQAGGHNGMSSIIQRLGTEKIARLKIGIAEQKTGKQEVPAEKYVLQNFSKTTDKKVKAVLQKISNIVSQWIQGNIKNTTFEF